MDTYFIVIHPSGDVDRHFEPDAASHARVLFEGNTDVVTLRMTFFDSQALIVGWVHGTGLLDGMPINRKAWFLYGRSPIYGPMVVAFDCDDDGNRQPLPEEFVADLFTVYDYSSAINIAMDKWLDENPEFPR